MANRKGLRDELARKIARAIPSVAVHIAGGFGFSLRPTAEVQQSKSSHSSATCDILITTKRGAPLTALAIHERKLAPEELAAVAAHSNTLRSLYPHLSYGLVVGRAQNLPAGLTTSSVSFALAMGTKNTDWKPVIRFVKRQTKLALFAYKRSKRPKPARRIETVVKVK